MSMDRVAIVEDNEDNRVLLEALLESRSPIDARPHLEAVEHHRGERLAGDSERQEGDESGGGDGVIGRFTRNQSFW